MTNLVKCNVCNIVIDEMLSYIQNKLSVIDEETLTRICISSFTGDEIKKSKSLLFDSIPSDLRKISRKSKGKEERDLADIVSLFKTAEPDVIPVFVARQLEKLPPITFDHLDCTKLLKDITRLKADMEDIKSTYATCDELSKLKTEFLQYQTDSLPPSPPPASPLNVNKKRGAWMLDSGPVGMTHVPISSPNKYKDAENSQEQENNYRDIKRVDGRNKSPLQMHNFESGVINTIDPELPPLPARAPPLPAIHVPASAVTLISNKRNTSVTQYENKKETDDNNGWQIVSKQKRRVNYRYLSKTGTSCDMEGKFKAADKKIPIFISNIHIDTSQDEIARYIYTKTQEKVSLEKISKLQKEHVSYKFFVEESKLPIFLDEKLWPKGIIFRRFVNYKHRNVMRANTADGVEKVNNG